MRGRISFQVVGFFLAAVALGIDSCGGKDRVGIPQPEPLPQVSLLRNTGVRNSGPAELTLVGLEKTCAGAKSVTVVGREGTFSGNSTTAGSFALNMRGTGEETVQIRCGTSETASYELRPGPTGTCPPGVWCQPLPPPPGELPGVVPVTAPVNGQTTVRGSTMPSTPVIAFNRSTGSVALATTDAQGAFTLSLDARTGDTIAVYRDSNPLLSEWTLTVP